MHRHYTELARNLRKTLVYQTGVSPLGLLRNCYDYALNDSTALTGAFDAVRDELRLPGARAIFEAVKVVNDFRNTPSCASREAADESRRDKSGLVEVGGNIGAALAGKHGHDLRA